METALFILDDAIETERNEWDYWSKMIDCHPDHPALWEVYEAKHRNAHIALVGVRNKLMVESDLMELEARIA